MSKKTEIAVYYFPQYHVDPKNEKWHGEGWSEWEMVKKAKPRFPGHKQPKEPVWGYYDEADPKVSEKQIKTAKEHGIDTFIYDWYWYDDEPFLHRALEQGFMQAENNKDLNFSLMWANHDWLQYYPVKRNKHIDTLTTGKVSRKSFEKAIDYIINTYFTHPSYWKIEGKPYFSIFETSNLVKGLGDLEETREALDFFREKTKEAGFPDLHLNCVIHGIYPFVPSPDSPKMNDILEKLGYDSTTPYNWGFHLKDFPEADYRPFAEKNIENWEKVTKQLKYPYFPNITIGWDSSPRTDQDDIYENLGYPYTPVLVNNTPEEFYKVLVSAKQFLDKELTNPPVLIINAWNEWTEGCYLEPDKEYGMAYLEAVKKVFGV